MEIDNIYLGYFGILFAVTFSNGFVILDLNWVRGVSKV